MNEEQLKRFEKTLLASKKFVAFLLTLAVLTGIAAFIIWKTVDAGDLGMWTAIVLTATVVAISFVSLANNVSQARLDSAVRLASILKDAFPTDKLKDVLGK